MKALAERSYFDAGHFLHAEISQLNDWK